MEEKMKQVLYKWLEIDLVNIAKKMGLSNKSCDVNLELLMDTIRCLDCIRQSFVVFKRTMLASYLRSATSMCLVV